MVLFLFVFFSFWGKFGERTNMKQSQYIYDQAEFLRLVTDTTKTLSDYYIINPETIMVEYQHDDEHVPDSPTGNIVIAAFTTCWARLKLYELISKVGRHCLYYDTDSVIYTDDGSVDVPLGDYLGELTDELDGDHIVEFVSGGPKNYAYVTSSGQITCKVKGFTLNYANMQRVNFDIMRDLVINRSTDKVTLQPYNQITRNKRKCTIYNTLQKKDYRVVYTKRRRLDNYDTEPYGY